ncbi:FAD-dependent monooxygenase (plasmid) [Streptomyces sp. N50]|nr:FAD-dependent monooxygenase [Streptomyces sp. N50]WOX17200.1 FAD-dependent monooxygenase [Streptomyces sp. N50]
MRPGLLLIGDSAHTHGPIGAQGINLAIQDAVAAHPTLMSSLRSGDDGTGPLREYVTSRGRDVRRIMKIQRMQSKVMLSTGGSSSAIRPRAAAVVSRTPVYRTVLNQLAFGNRAIDIRGTCSGPPCGAERSLAGCSGRRKASSSVSSRSSGLSGRSGSNRSGWPRGSTAAVDRRGTDALPVRCLSSASA